jgi:hypothetical protein
MGIYAETSAEIICKTEEDAKKVYDFLTKLSKEAEKEHDLNFNFNDLNLDMSYVYFDLASGRIQNLEWQCEQIWEKIKDLGVNEFNCPIMSEANNIYFSNDEDYNK